MEVFLPVGEEHAIIPHWRHRIDLASKQALGVLTGNACGGEQLVGQLLDDVWADRDSLAMGATDLCYRRLGPVRQVVVLQMPHQLRQNCGAMPRALDGILNLGDGHLLATSGHRGSGLPNMLPCAVDKVLMAELTSQAPPNLTSHDLGPSPALPP